jgi:hypothetical protein
MVRGVSIYHPDTAHLHLKLFHFFRPQPNYKKIANAIMTRVLAGLWLFPLLTISWVYQKQLFIWISAILFIILYSLFYLFVPSSKKQQ